MSFQKLISFFLSVILFFSSGVAFGKCDLDTARAVSSSAYAREGCRLTEYILKKSCDRKSHVFKEYLGDSGTSYIWATGSVIEMIADAYRLFPANLKLRTYYGDALTKVPDKELDAKDTERLFDPFFCSGGSTPEAYRSLLSQGGVDSTFLNAAYYDAAVKDR